MITLTKQIIAVQIITAMTMTIIIVAEDIAADATAVTEKFFWLK